MVVKQSAIMIGLTVFVLAGGFVLGIPVLSVVYGVDLAGYKTELMGPASWRRILGIYKFLSDDPYCDQKTELADCRLSSGIWSVFDSG